MFYVLRIQNTLWATFHMLKLKHKQLVKKSTSKSLGLNIKLLEQKYVFVEVKIANQARTIFWIIGNTMVSYPSECIENYVSLALWCCNDKPQGRRR